MSTDTNSPNDDLLLEEEFYLYVDGKSILAHIASPLHSDFANVPWSYYESISGAEFWGILREGGPLQNVLLTITDPILIVIHFDDSEDGDYYLKLTYDEYQEFITYCDDKSSKTNLDWRTAGF